MGAMDRWNLAKDSIEPHHPVVLASDEGAARAVAVHLPAGESMQEHQTHEYTWVTMIEGAADFTDGGETVSAGPGFVARFAPGERREITARTDSRLLLLLAPWPGDGHPSHS